MPRFILKITAFILVQATIAAVLLSNYPGVSTHFFAATIDKHQLAETAPGPRLIIVGGSNAMYPFDSPRLHHLTGYHPVNLSMYGPLQARFMLNEAADVARPGDVILLSLEYSQFDSDGRIPPGDLAILLEARPASIRYVSWRSLQRLLDNGIGCIQDVLFTPENAWRRLTNSIYNRHGFNAYGDFIAHEAMGSHYQTSPPSGKDDPVTADDVKWLVFRLNRFIDECAARQVRVVFAYPPFDQALVERKPLVHAVEEAMRVHFKGTVLNTPRLAAKPAALLFDSPYHVTREGKAAHMSHLLEPLLRFLKQAP